MMLERETNFRAIALGCALAAGLLVAGCGKQADGREADEHPAADAPAVTEAAADKVAAATESSDPAAADATAEQAVATPAGEVKLPADPAPAKAPAPDNAAIASGSATFANNCASCHGEGGAGGFGPALNKLANRKDKRPLGEIIRKPGPSMPPLYPAMLSDQDVVEVTAYLNSIQ
jgi:mono/diheme cytochrome c family protein